MVYCVVFGCNSNSYLVVVVKTFHFPFSGCVRQRGRKNFTTTTITITTERNTVNHYDKIYCVFET